MCVKTLNLKQLTAKQVVYPTCEASILKLKVESKTICLTHNFADPCVKLEFYVPFFFFFFFFVFLFKYPLLLLFYFF
jgi:hypothetical protein